MNKTQHHLHPLLMELFQNISLFFPWNPYRTHAIISHGLYIFYPISKDHFFVFQQFFSENSVIMYGLYSERLVIKSRL